MSSTELKEFRMGSFLAGKEVFFMGINLSDVKDGIQSCLHDLLRLRCDLWILSQNNFFGFIGFSMEQNFAPFTDDFGKIETF